MVAVLGVTGAMTRGSEWYRDRWFRSRCREVAVHFDDWLVDGVPLRRLVSSRRGGEVVEQMTLLDHERQNPEETMRYLARLSGHGEAAFADGRIPLLVCQMCWDLGCGAVSAELIMAGDLVRWERLGYQDNYQDLEGGIEPELALAFDRAQYFAVMDSVRLRFGRAG